MIDVSTDPDGIAVVRLAHGPVNALDLELVGAIVETFADLPGSGARAAVLTGNGRAFSAGVDLLRVLDGGADYLAEFLPRLSDAFEAVWTAPIPVVAAVEGAAIAGGCVLACAADHRVMSASKARVGVTELAVGVPFPVVALEVVRSCVGDPTARSLVLGEEVLDGPAALGAGLADELAESEELVATATARAGSLAAIPPESGAITKEQLRRPFAERVERHRDADDRRVLAAWQSEACQAAIAAFAAEHLGRGSER